MADSPKNRTRGSDLTGDPKISKDDIAHAQQSWRNVAPQKFKTLLDATTDTDSALNDAE